MILSTESAKLMTRILSHVWDSIACDIFQCYADSDGGSAESVTIPQDEVIEVVLDASRPEEELKREVRKRFLLRSPLAVQSFEEYKTAQKEWTILTYDQRIEFARTVFKCEHYGM